MSTGVIIFCFQDSLNKAKHQLKSTGLFLYKAYIQFPRYIQIARQLFTIMYHTNCTYSRWKIKIARFTGNHIVRVEYFQWCVGILINISTNQNVMCSNILCCFNEYFELQEIITVTPLPTSWHLKTPAVRLFAQQLVQSKQKRKHQSSASLALCKGLFMSCNHRITIVSFW